MSSSITQLADEIAAVINTAEQAGDYGALEFTARRSYPDWDDDFNDLKDLAVDVVPVTSGGDLVELDSVSTGSSDQSIDIAVRKRLNATSDRDVVGRLKNTSVDPLVGLVEKLYETLAGDRMTAIIPAAGITANWMDTTVRTYCDYKRLREGCFLGVVRVRFDVSRAM